MTDWHRGTIQKDSPGIMVVCSFKNAMTLERTFKGNIKNGLGEKTGWLSIFRKNAVNQVKRQG